MSARAGESPPDLFALVDVEHLDHVVDVGEILDGKMIIVHRVEGIFLHEFADFEQVAEGTADADHLRFGIHVFQPGLFFQLFGEELLDFFRRLLGRAVPREQVGERDGAEGQRRVTEHVAAVVIHDLRAAAADFQNQPLGDIHRIDDAAIDERRLLFLGEDAYFYVAGSLNLVEEGTLIFRAADGRGGHRDDPVHARRIAQPLEHLQRADGLRHPLRLQKAVAVHVLSEADALFQLVHHHEMSLRKQVDDDEPRRIGTQIDNAYFFHFSLPHLSRQTENPTRMPYRVIKIEIRIKQIYLGPRGLDALPTKSGGIFPCSAAAGASHRRPPKLFHESVFP